MITGLKAGQVSTGTNHTLVRDLDNNLWSFGGNNKGQLGLGHLRNSNTPTSIPTLKVRQVTAGDNYSIVIDQDYYLWSFGYNIYG